METYMRLDHLAYRTFNRDKTVQFFIDAFGYKFQAEFEIFFNDEKTDKALCIALEPPEKIKGDMPFSVSQINPGFTGIYHMAPEIFVSEGTPGSIVHNWCVNNGNRPGVHHMAYEVPDVEEQRKLWIEKGWGDFTSQVPFKCEDLTQIFSKPSLMTGMIYEFIERKGAGFCKNNVKALMESTAKIDGNIL
jgi:catechol 2,3-dioxygenase-like lactoylglutathione lyase family enzyme